MKAKGRAEYEKFKKGKSLTRHQSIIAKCYECMCHYADGRVDCEVVGCPLYPYHPYGGKNE